MPDRLNPTTHASHGPYSWCSLCERVNLTQTWVTKGWRCPTPGCAALAVHARPWYQVRQLQPRYPETPEVGKRYSFSDPTGGI